MDDKILKRKKNSEEKQYAFDKARYDENKATELKTKRLEKDKTPAPALTQTPA